MWIHSEGVKGLLSYRVVRVNSIDETGTLVFELLANIRQRMSDSFMGVGVILYDAPMCLPVASLGNQLLFQPRLPVKGLERVANTLAEISTADSPWHDGFHLVDVNGLCLTHVSQFLAPPLEFLNLTSSIKAPIGARQMAALAGSRIPSVKYIALIDSAGRSLVFRKGKQVSKGAGE